MNYIFGFSLCIVFILINITYENFIKKNKIIDIKKYLYQSIILFLAYYALVNVFLYFKMYDKLILFNSNNNNDTIQSSSTFDKPLIFTNDPNF